MNIRTLSDEESARLAQLGSHLAGVDAGPWQPRCVARAFASRTGPVFTMQAWIDLDAARSPILQGLMPSNDDEIRAALVAFGWRGDDPLASTPDAMTAACAEMAQAVHEAFALALPMDREGSQSLPADGFGDWLPLLARLVETFGSLERALACPVDQAFALRAAHLHNEGWRCAGEPYSARDTIAPMAPITPIAPIHG